MRAVCASFTGILLIAATTTAGGGESFVNWESPHVSPLDVTPDGTKLLAVNTADNRLEVFSISSIDGGLSALGAIPVGLDPVSVRARTDGEAWVVNHVSDTVSVVDLAAMNVVATLHPGDEPADVVFAGNPSRAFVSVSQRNEVVVYDPADLSAPPAVLSIEGEDPRALATDGTTVYAAIFESGNETTILDRFAVSDPLVNPYPDAQNPPPNDGPDFDPPMAAVLPVPPPAGLIVVKDAVGIWRDVNGADWSAGVTWDLHDHDVALIDAETLAITYATGLMNANMALGVHPAGGVTVVGTDAINEVRFEPNVRGIFLRVIGATVAGPGPGATNDLNPHLDYQTPTVDQTIRDLSIGDPRGIAWSPDGAKAFITGMGSGNVAVVDGAMNRLGLIEVGEGPTGVQIDTAGERVYVLNRFEGSVSVIDAGALIETQRVVFFDPTPQVIRDGRPFLYDTHGTSGLGQASCASCHIDGRMDQIAWDLGDPSGQMQPFEGDCGLPPCSDWHPVKGPMATQTLIGIIGTGRLHWRGDREDLAAFNPAFESLMSDDTQLSDAEMQQFEAFVATLTLPPNPYRLMDGSLPAMVSNGGDPANGLTIFQSGGHFNCSNCHAGSTGTSGEIRPGSGTIGLQSIKVAQLRNLYEKTGFDAASTSNNRGFGFTHDGGFPKLTDFLDFAFPLEAQGLLDVEAFLLCFSSDTHAGVGVQATLPQAAGARAGPALSDMINLAEAGSVGLVVKGVVNGEQRGWYLSAPGSYQSDRAAETADEAALLALAGPGSELTFTLVPSGSEIRIGVDRDEDGHFDRDEIDAGSDPADPGSIPDSVLSTATAPSASTIS
jgi:YVTN family beta-propeller protein